MGWDLHRAQPADHPATTRSGRNCTSHMDISSDVKNGKTLKGLTLKTRRLEEVLDSVGAPRHIDYFSLDVEGAEEEVLSESFPFGRYIQVPAAADRRATAAAAQRTPLWSRVPLGSE